MTTVRVPRVFLSYAWEDESHKSWVRELAARLRGDGVETVLDQWELVPGDQLPQFMERAVRDSDFVLVICTPEYKKRSDKRSGGVGYEGDVMTGEVFTLGRRRKFIPVLRRGAWTEAAPSWLAGALYVCLSGDPYGDDDYQALLNALHSRNPVAPAVGGASGSRP